MFTYLLTYHQRRILKKDAPRCKAFISGTLGDTGVYSISFLSCVCVRVCVRVCVCLCVRAGVYAWANHQHQRRRSTLRETPSASGSTAPCTVCCVPCHRSRSPGGPSICRSWSRRATTRLTPRPASHPNSCSLDRSPDCRWTTCWDVLLPLQRGQLTG